MLVLFEKNGFVYGINPVLISLLPQELPETVRRQILQNPKDFFNTAIDNHEKIVTKMTQHGYGQFAKEPIQEGTYFIYFGEVTKTLSCRPSDYTFSLNNSSGIEEIATWEVQIEQGIGGAHLFQHAPTKQELNEMYELIPPTTIADVMLQNCHSHICFAKLSDFTNNPEHRGYLPILVLVLTTDLEKNQQLMCNYGKNYWQARKIIPSLYKKEGMELEKTRYNPKGIILSITTQLVDYNNLYSRNFVLDLFRKIKTHGFGVVDSSNTENLYIPSPKALEQIVAVADFQQDCITISEFTLFIDVNTTNISIFIEGRKLCLTFKNQNKNTFSNEELTLLQPYINNGWISLIPASPSIGIAVNVDQCRPTLINDYGRFITTLNKVFDNALETFTPAEALPVLFPRETLTFPTTQKSFTQCVDEAVKPLLHHIDPPESKITCSVKSENELPIVVLDLNTNNLEQHETLLKRLQALNISCTLNTADKKIVIRQLRELTNKIDDLLHIYTQLTQLAKYLTINDYWEIRAVRNDNIIPAERIAMINLAGCNADQLNNIKQFIAEKPYTDIAIKKLKKDGPAYLRIKAADLTTLLQELKKPMIQTGIPYSPS